MLFCPNFHRLEALEACLEACPEVFCSNVHGLPTLEFEILFHPIFFCFAAIFHTLEASRLALRPSFAPAAA